MRARTKRHRAANTEQEKAKRRGKATGLRSGYRQAHKEQGKAYNRAYYATNREKRLAYMVARRAAKKSPR